MSERDLGGAKLPTSLGEWTVEDVMTSPVVTVTTRTPIRRAAALMKGRSIGSLVVTSATARLRASSQFPTFSTTWQRKPERHSNKELRRSRRAYGRSRLSRVSAPAERPRGDRSTARRRRALAGHHRRRRRRHHRDRLGRAASRPSTPRPSACSAMARPTSSARTSAC